MRWPLLARYVPLDGWLVLLADGWELPWIVEPMGGHHGSYWS